MNSIVIKVSDLRQKVRELANDKMDYVELSLVESDDESPSFISLHGMLKNDDCAIDYEEIDAVSFDEINP